MATNNRTIAYLRADEPDPTPSLFVSTIFEDETTGRKAQNLIGRIVKMAGAESPPEEHAWGFEVFDKPDGMAASARRASAADVLVVAAYRDTTALQRVAEWLKHWVAPRRTKHGALVFVGIERKERLSASDPAEDQLARVAQQIGMDFFATHIPAIVEPRDGDRTIHFPP